MDGSTGHVWPLTIECDRAILVDERAERGAAVHARRSHCRNEATARVICMYVGAPLREAQGWRPQLELQLFAPLGRNCLALKRVASDKTVLPVNYWRASPRAAADWRVVMRTIRVSVLKRRRGGVGQLAVERLPLALVDGHPPRLDERQLLPHDADGAALLGNGEAASPDDVVRVGHTLA